MSDGYGYEDISGKVLRNDKRLLDERREKNVNTNPQTMAGRISVEEMGAKLNRETPSEEKSRIKAEIDRSEAKRTKETHKEHTVRISGSGILDSNIETFDYYPRDAPNRAVFGEILEWCSKQLDDDVPEDVVRSLADTVLAVLKNEASSEKEMKKEIEDTLGDSISDEQYETVSRLGREITDYGSKETVVGEDAIGVVDEEDDEGDASEDIDDNESDEDSEKETGDADVNVNGPDDGDDDNTVTLSHNDSQQDRINIRDVDKYWLTRKLGQEFPDWDTYKRTETSKEISSLLAKVNSGELELRKLEHSLAGLLGEESPTARLIVSNSSRIYNGLRLAEADPEERDAILKSLDDGTANESRSSKREHSDDEEPDTKRQRSMTGKPASAPAKDTTPQYIDLSSLVFDQGSRLMTTSKFQLPKGSFKRAKKSWEEVHIPPPESASDPNERLVPISELPEWTQEAFPSAETKTLNRIQSKVFPQAFENDCNILMCAPTGAGKTNVAMLTILEALSHFRDSHGKLKLNEFKIVYIAPLKALVQEQVREFQRRLNYLGIHVNELTGDSNLTKHQIASTQILVTTPEKWDVITRKNNDASYVKLVCLVIFDEIHLLHDERGPAIESLVARSSLSPDPVRLVGLSATLPNYKDVAEFLKVPSEGLFYFDATYRPCPLAQQFIGITEKKSLKKYQAMNDACYEKVVETLREGQQAIVFVHSRKDTAKTAKYLVDKLVEEGELSKLINQTAGAQEILRSEAEKARSDGLKSVLPSGFAIHHAGMKREDRSTAEDLFAQGYVKVLVSTATLAWGVNLPAHTVVIKGTSVYSPEQGSWVELSPQDILQMLGRAGRPRYDTHGEGIIITSQDEVKYYLAILNQQLPIESQMYSKLADNINAEVVAGRINSLDDCITWLGATYLYVRMMHNRTLYRVGPNYDDDLKLTRRRRDLAYSALTLLAKYRLLKYDYRKDTLIPTNLGKVASFYYISHESIRQYDQKLKPYFSEIELFEIFSGSEEFKYLRVRDEEKGEMKRLLQKCPIPVKGDFDDPLAKINILLQAYISRMQLDGFALLTDMVYVVQSAGRLFRAMYELACRKRWASLSRILLQICKMVDNRMWLTNSPLRQIPGAPKEIIRTSERSLMPWKQYLALKDQNEIIHALKAERFGNTAYELLQKFPKLDVGYAIQPLTRSLLELELNITPQWKWDVSVHGFSESFTVFVEDSDSQRLLYADSLLVHKKYIGQPHYMKFTVPLLDADEPALIVSIISDRWLNCETREGLTLDYLTLPKKFPAPTQLLEQTPVRVESLGDFSKVFDFDEFNFIESQVVDPLFNENDNILCCTSKGNGKTTTLSVLALLNHWRQGGGRAVYVNPSQENIDTLFKKWKKRLSKLAGGKVIKKLTGETSEDLKLLASSHLLLGTPKQFDLLTKRWPRRKNVQSIELVIADDCHRVADVPVYEVILSRIRFIAESLDKEIRIVALGSSIANSKDYAEWLGISRRNIYDFDSKERVHPVEVKFEDFEIKHNPSAMECMVSPAYGLINSMDEEKGEEKAIVFVPTRRQCVDFSSDFIARLTKDDYSWLRTDEEALEPHLRKVQETSLKVSLKYGVGLYYEGMAHSDKSLVEKLFKAGALSCLVATKGTASFCEPANKVIVITTETYNGREHRYVPYALNDLFEMVGLARVEDGTAKAVVMSNNINQINYYKKFISESLPVESSMPPPMSDWLLNDISTGLIKNRQNGIDWMTYTYYYRRIQQNQSYYGTHASNSDELSESLSELLESMLDSLASDKLIELDYNDDADENIEEDAQEITPLNGGMIASYYDISHSTMRLFANFTAKTKLKEILHLISCAHEFKDLPIRQNEEGILFKLYNSLPVKWPESVDFESPKFKTFVLLQAHFSRLNLPQDLKMDLEFILSNVLKVLYAAVDSMSSEGYLNAVNVMDLSQMIVQGLWDSDNPLKQIPYFDNDKILDKCKKLKVETVYDVMALDDDERDMLLKGLPESHVSQVAEFVNSYPNTEISYELDTSKPIVANEPKTIKIKIERDDEPEGEQTVVASHYPFTKREHWWLVVGEPKTKQLYAIKKLAIDKVKVEVDLEFTIPTTGKHKLAAWCICDSYMDADKQVEIAVVDVN